VAVDSEGYCYQVRTKGLANCRGNTGDRIAKELEGMGLLSDPPIYLTQLFSIS